MSNSSGPERPVRKPVVIPAEALGPAAPVAEAPPVPEPLAPPAAMTRATKLAAGTRFGWFGGLVASALAGLVALAVGVAAWDFVFGLLGRNVWLGRAALVLLGVVAVWALSVIWREIAAWARLGRIDALQRQAADPQILRDRAGALAFGDRLLALYAPREELRLGSAELREQRAEILDADALMAATETALMKPLDTLARAEVEAAARQVAAATALVPLALADVAAALVANVRMVRRVAQVYGGRAGALGSWRLLRAVAQHLIATGAVAVGDDLIGSVAGGGVMSKISRRFGEGVVNGALTARVGVAAMEVCRPMPFRALPRPRVTHLVRRALAGLFGGGG
ncbi:MAG: TIGR01620 family protein [Pseudomonadota bacterium]